MNTFQFINGRIKDVKKSLNAEGEIIITIVLEQLLIGGRLKKQLMAGGGKVAEWVIEAATGTLRGEDVIHRKVEQFQEMIGYVYEPSMRQVLRGSIVSYARTIVQPGETYMPYPNAPENEWVVSNWPEPKAVHAAPMVTFADGLVLSDMQDTYKPFIKADVVDNPIADTEPDYSLDDKGDTPDEIPTNLETTTDPVTEPPVE